MSILLQHDLLGLGEGYGRDLVDHRQLGAQHVELFLAVFLHIGDDILEHAGLHLHDVVHRVDVGHLKVKADVLVQVARSVVALGAVYVADLKNAAKDASGVLLIELGGLGQIGLLAEVVELKDVCTALGAGRDDLGRMDVGEALAEHILGKAVGNRALDAEDGLLARMAQGDRAQRQLGVQRHAQVFLAERDRNLLGRAGQDLDRSQDDLKAVLCAGLLAHVARDLNDHAVLDVCLGHAVDFAREHALDQAAIDADHDEGKIGHIAYAVHGAAEGDRLADRSGGLLDRVDILLGGADKLHSVYASLFGFDGIQNCYFLII